MIFRSFLFLFHLFHLFSGSYRPPKCLLRLFTKCQSNSEMTSRPPVGKSTLKQPKHIQTGHKKHHPNCKSPHILTIIFQVPSLPASFLIVFPVKTENGLHLWPFSWFLSSAFLHFAPTEKVPKSAKSASPQRSDAEPAESASDQTTRNEKLGKESLKKKKRHLRKYKCCSLIGQFPFSFLFLSSSLSVLFLLLVIS